MSDIEDQIVQHTGSERSPLKNEAKDETSQDYPKSPEQENGDAPLIEKDISTVLTDISIVTITSKDDKKCFASLEGELDFEEDNDPEPEKLDTQMENMDNSEDKPVSEDGQVSPEKEQKKQTAEDDDDGEISDEGDLEEGELREGSPSPKHPSRQVCRFYAKGQCTWGTVCRFLHLAANQRTGNYSMFASSPPSGYGSRSNRRSTDDLLPSPPPIPLLVSEPTPVESAWIKGLTKAKELVKKANKRKVEEPDFEEKSLNLSLQVNERNIPNDSKEDDSKNYRGRRRHYDSYGYDEEDPDVGYDNGDREFKENWRGGRFENFEVRWTREDEQRDRQDKERARDGRISRERDRFTRSNRSKEKWRDTRAAYAQNRTRAEDWLDPWRRSKSPKGNRVSRSRSGSYSSVSSYSYSERGSSRSSGSYSRSSSRSTNSSRSPAEERRKQLPRIDAPVPQKKPEPDRFSAVKKKIGVRRSSTRSRSVSGGSRSSRSLSMDSVSSASSSVSSRSRSPHNHHVSILRKNAQSEKASIERTKPILPVEKKLFGSVDKSKSVALVDRNKSLSSVDKNKSLASVDKSKLLASVDKSKSLTSVDKNKSLSLVDKNKSLASADKNKSLSSVDKNKPVPSTDKNKSGAYVEKNKSLTSSEKNKSALHSEKTKTSVPKDKSKSLTPANTIAPVMETLPIKIKEEPVDDYDVPIVPAKEDPKVVPLHHLHHLIPSVDKVKEPVKGLHKQQIKLTLLNKNPPSKPASFQKKDADALKAKSTDETSKPSGGVKRPLSPTAAALPAVAVKKSASSRRDELLKQLKAVEDAIARKRAKI